MAKGKKTGGRNFKPGNKGGPGRAPRTKAEKKLARMTKTQFENICFKLIRMTSSELEKHNIDRHTKVLEKMCGRIIERAYKSGDHIRLDFFLNRLFGKVKETIQIDRDPIRDMSDEELAIEYKRLRKKKCTKEND